LIETQHAIVGFVGNVQVARTVEADTGGIANSGGARARAHLGRETRAATALAENEVRSRIARASGRIERRQRLIEFEHSRVVRV